MEQDKYSFFTKQFDSWQDFEKDLKIGALVIMNQ
jgi:hypothetical protein